MDLERLQVQIKNPLNPLAIQMDKSTRSHKYSWTILLFPDRQRFKQVQQQVVRFAVSEYSDKQQVIYRITNVCLWNAASRGLKPKEVIETLEKFSIYNLPFETKKAITVLMNRYGLLELHQAEIEETFFPEPTLKLVSQDPAVLKEAEKSDPRLASFCLKGSTNTIWFIWPHHRARLKNLFTWAGFPIIDRAPKDKGISINIRLRKITKQDKPFVLRDYQTRAVQAFLSNSQVGTIIMPPGTGKTIVAIGAMARMKVHTLIIVKDVVALWQWKAELLDKTNLTEYEIGEYWWGKKEIRPVTITTYYTLCRQHKAVEQDDIMLVERIDHCHLDLGIDDHKEQIKTEPINLDKRISHIDLFNNPNWGLVVYDEDHHLPASVFRTTAQVQSIARLGMTASLIREDGREIDVFSLIGPVCYQYAWRKAGQEKWIPNIMLHRVLVGLSSYQQQKYRKSEPRIQKIIAWENHRKIPVLKAILDLYQEDFILIFGELVQTGFLKRIGKKFGIPFIHGNTPYEKRQVIYDQFRAGQINRIVLTRVGDMAVDLPDANIGIQLNGNYGSRQQEAQRLGRLLRPKHKTAHFYSLVSDCPIEAGKFRLKRESWMIGQGYQYEEEDEFLYIQRPS